MGTRVQNIRKAKFIEQQGQCYYCFQPMWEKNGEDFAVMHGLSASQVKRLRSTAEHLVAQQNGGCDTRQNIVAACTYCNRTRHKTRRPKTSTDYAQMVRKKLCKGKWHGIKLMPISQL
jgi:5-methylcytosine-specific restriction endonuclease McrA